MKKKSLAPKPKHSPTVVLPDKDLIIETVEIFFENQYKGIFPIFHKPTFMSFLRSDEFNPTTFIELPPITTPLQPNPVVLLAILALSARLQNTLPDALNASLDFGWHARKLVLEEFDNPSLSNVQALCVLSSHEWGEGNASRSYMYVGLAARMAMILGLNEEPTGNNELENEVRRRAIWGVYMMDRCNSSGRKGHSCISLSDIHVRLPDHERNFIFGEIQTQCFRNDVDKPETDRTKVSCNGFMIYLFEIWREIGTWVGVTGSKLEPLAPWDPESPFFKLSKRLDRFEEQLPSALNFSHLEEHISFGSAADFAYFHGLFFLCRIFLNREYFYALPDIGPPGWWNALTAQLFETLDKLDLIAKRLKPMNLMVIAPFTGFQVFTAGATSLYIAAYPPKVLKQHFPNQPTQRFKAMARDCLTTLNSWRQSWGLGKNWIETLHKLDEMFSEVADLQADEIRHSISDYGNIENTMQILHVLSEETKEEDPLNAMHNLDLSSIFPDWNEAMNFG